jgi:hypothetical protein
MPDKQNLISRHYRIRQDQDYFLKSFLNNDVEILRFLIDYGIAHPEIIPFQKSN